MEIRFSTKNYAHQSNLIEGIDNEEADLALRRAWRETGHMRWEKKLSHASICRAQETITSWQEDLYPIHRGAYRDRSRAEVRVGGTRMPSFEIVQRLMDEWLLKYGDLRVPYDTKQAHIEFEKIHPFVDGNGRTGRLLYWVHESCQRKMPTLFLNDEKDAYFKWFQN